MKFRHLLTMSLGLFVAGWGSTASAADGMEPYPQRPIKLVVPWSPGGFTDALARSVAEQMGRVMGQPITVENRPGANGILGTESVARAAPDGYTLLVATAETHAINPSIYAKLRYDAVADFTPVGSIASVPLFLVTNIDVAEKTFPELMVAARKTPSRFKYASWGNGSTGHLAFELLNAPAHIEMIHIPYKGLGPALTDVLAGRVDMTMATAQSIHQFVTADKLRVLAVTSPKRSGVMPAVPAISEMGYPAYDVSLWYGVVAPARTPAAVVEKLNSAMRQALADPAFKAKMAASDAEVRVGTPADFSEFLRQERSKWAGAAKTANVQLEQ